MIFLLDECSNAILVVIKTGLSYSVTVIQVFKADSLLKNVFCPTDRKDLTESVKSRILFENTALILCLISRMSDCWQHWMYKALSSVLAHPSHAVVSLNFCARGVC